MANMGKGYGSECHLLRYLGRHRKLLNDEIIKTVPAQSIDWVDFGFDDKAEWQDKELEGIDFLPEKSRLDADWKTFWPTGKGIHNWDAVAALESGARSHEWLLVEAKAHMAEIQTVCHAKPEGGLGKITDTLEEVKKKLGVSSNRDWLKPYYQYCNRVAFLSFLDDHRISAHLLFIYFTGDRVWPTSEDEWRQTLHEQDMHIGLPENHSLSERIHEIFLPVCPQKR